MNKQIFLAISCFSILSIPFLLWQNNVSEAQTRKDDQFFMAGSIENDRKMTGFYSKNANAAQNKNWCVFIGENGKVYKIWLIDKNIHSLHIDGIKIADDQIWKHTAEYKPYLEKMWRINELEEESAEIDDQIRPIDQKIAALDKEMEKLDKKDEEIEKKKEQIDKNSLNFDDTRKNIDAQRRKLSKMIEERSKEIEILSKKQGSLVKEIESLNLMSEMDKIFRQITIDLKSLGVIKNSANLSFKLSNSELIVNGKKVSTEVYDLLKARYIVEMDGNFGFVYQWKGEV